MKQEVNFYQEQFYEKKIIFSFQKMQLAFIGSVLISLGLSILLFILNDRNKNEFDRLKEKDEAITLSINSLTEQISKQRINPELEKSVTFANWQILAKQEVLNLISDKDKKDPNLFSNLLLGLARQNVKGLWLVEINIDKGGNQILLKGSALTADLIPVLIGKLKDEPAFLGRQFKTVLFEREDIMDHKIDFVLNTSSLDGDLALLSGVN